MKIKIICICKNYFIYKYEYFNNYFIFQHNLVYLVCKLFFENSQYIFILKHIKAIIIETITLKVL